MSMIRITQNQGLTLIEIVIASIIGGLIAAGTMQAFIAAIRISRLGSQNSQVAFLAQETIERLRNNIACDNAGWFNPADCDQGVTQVAVDDTPAGVSGLNWRRFSVVPDNNTASLDLDGDGTIEPSEPANVETIGAGQTDYFVVTVNVDWTPP